MTLYYSRPLLIVLTILTFSTLARQDQPIDSQWLTRFEKSNGTETATYEEVLSFYKKLAENFDHIQLDKIGSTDSGQPLHYVTLGKMSHIDHTDLQKEYRTLLINNGIHPGESDGIDATMMLFRDYALKKIPLPEQTILVAIPVYNIGGALNRNSTTRTNQNGPKAYGFRGNARNYDLNRDFIKSDTRNARAFAKLFHLLQPDVFVDTHVSNGADYQYTLTHLFTQHNQLGNELGTYLHTTFQPAVERALTRKNWDITPYVNVWGTTPEQGWSQFLDSPRYSTGYTSLWNTLGLMIETHMLKPYKKRVTGTYELLKTLVAITEKDGEKIRALRTKAFENNPKMTTYPIHWQVDSTRHTQLEFKGYEGTFDPSELTGSTRLQYHPEKPYVKTVPYYNFYTPQKEITVPKAYLIPKGWWEVIAILKTNNVAMRQLQKDTTLTVAAYHIADYKTKTTPYEGHYLHYDTHVTTTTENVPFKKGDYMVLTNQKAFRYLIETLEPETIDSFFSWNYFDTILQQKEGFSAYVWEEKAAELLEKNAELAARFKEKKKDPAFAKNEHKQLDWLHKHSKHYEKAHLRYPIYRLIR